MSELDIYAIQHREPKGDWSFDDMGADTPFNKRSAAEHLKTLKDEMPDCEFRVWLLEMDTNGFSDVTISIEAEIEGQEAERAQQAAEDAAHIRQESFGWRCAV